MEQLQPQLPPQLQPQPQHSATPASATATRESAATPKSTRPPRGDNRCRRRTRVHGRCRLPVHDRSTGLCFHHAAAIRRTTYALSAAPDRADLSSDLFGGPTPPTFDSPEDINRTLANLVTLVAQGRISTRRASVITYALSFILRGLQVMDQKALDVAVDEPAGLICDIDSAVARHARALAAQRHIPIPDPAISDPAVRHDNAPQTCVHASSTAASKDGVVHSFGPLSSPTPERIHQET